jgi:hypothetical protein
MKTHSPFSPHTQLAMMRPGMLLHRIEPTVLEWVRRKCSAKVFKVNAALRLALTNKFCFRPLCGYVSGAGGVYLKSAHGIILALQLWP